MSIVEYKIKLHVPWILRNFVRQHKNFYELYKKYHLLLGFPFFQYQSKSIVYLNYEN